MSQTKDSSWRLMLDGSDRSIVTRIILAGARCVEPVYGAVVGCRNFIYDGGIFSAHDLGRPTVSVGNITTGGTGKTPMVRWVAEQLMAAGHRPAVLMRGYKSSGGISDEREILAKDLPGIPIVANPDRVAGARQALLENALTTVFILDDGMQHRRAHRDANLVLIHAAEPFGFGHLLPRGMLREPLKGLVRGDAFVVTHCGEVGDGQIEEITRTIRLHNPAAPIYRCDHLIPSLRATDGASTPLEAARGRRVFAFCGIGSPGSFFATLKKAGIEPVGSKAFADHHAYTAEDWRRIQELARGDRAEILITTEKDWVKIAGIIGPNPGGIPVFRAELALEFRLDFAQQLSGLILKTVGQPGLH